MFEGDYLNGLRNGKGKLYYEERECEYLNGIRNGKGKDNNENGNLYFEREFFNDKLWKGKS